MEEWVVGPAQAESILDTARVEGWVPNKRRGGRPTATLDDPAPGPAPAPCSPAPILHTSLCSLDACMPVPAKPPSAPWLYACQRQRQLSHPLLPSRLHASASQAALCSLCHAQALPCCKGESRREEEEPGRGSKEEGRKEKGRRKEGS